MTIRDHLNRHMRRATISCWLAIPPALVGVSAAGHPVVQRVALVVAGIFAASNLFWNISARCPQCRTRLLLVLSINGVRLMIPSWFNACPTCGLSFDTQFHAPPKSNQVLGQPLPAEKFALDNENTHSTSEPRFQ